VKQVAVTGALLVVLLAIGAGWLVNCTGPRPEVQSVQLEEPESPDHPYRVQAELRNKGRNGGEVTVVFELVDRDSGKVYRRKDNFELKGRESVSAVAEIEAPSGSYDARAKAIYPPD
jgi:hypothetical protein